MGIEGNRQYNPGWHLALDLEFMFAVAEALVRAALARTESRGGHTRDDYPQPSEEMGRVNMIARYADGEASVTPEPLAELPAELAALLEEG